MLPRNTHPARPPAHQGIHVQHPQRPQHPLTATHAAIAVQVMLLGLLLLFALPTPLWQDGAQATTSAPVGISTPATGTDLPGDTNPLPQENPATLRRVAKPRLTPAASVKPADPLLVSRLPASPANARVPAATSDIARPAPGRRQQRGQAPPLG